MLVITTFKITNSSHFICCFESLNQIALKAKIVKLNSDKEIHNTRSSEISVRFMFLNSATSGKGYEKALLQRFSVQLISWAAPRTLRHSHSSMG